MTMMSMVTAAAAAVAMAAVAAAAAPTDCGNTTRAGAAGNFEDSCAAFDGDCAECLLSADPGPDWGSPCLYLSAPAQGHRCVPAKWWARYAGRFSCASPMNCTLPAAGCKAGGSARAGCWSGHWGASSSQSSACDPCPGVDRPGVPGDRTASLPHGPILGDGEAGVVFGVDKVRGALTGYFAANSFWLYNRDTWGHTGRSEQRGIGGVTLSVADENGTPLVPAPRYALEQDLQNGSVRFSLYGQGDEQLLVGTATISQGVGGDSTGEGGAASALVTTLTGGQRRLEISWATWVYPSSTVGSNSNGTSLGGISYAARQLNGTHRPVVAVLASRRVAATGQQAGLSAVDIAPGEAVTIVTSMLTSVTTGVLNDTLALALQANTHTDAATTVAQAASFWRTFWGQSSITLPPKWAAVERYLLPARKHLSVCVSVLADRD